MSSDLRIRPMQAPDLPAYKSLRDLMLTRHPEAFTSDAETETRRDLSYYQSRLPGDTTLFTLLACEGSQLLGALTCERERRRKVQHVTHLVGMMVLPRLQGRGIGGALLDDALARLRALPELAMVTLSVTRSNDSAVRLYASRGFERYGRLPGAIRLPDGRELDKDLMMLRLQPSGA